MSDLGKTRPTYRLSKWSIPWIVAALFLLPYEIVTIILHVDGGPLTHVVKWAYGPQYGARWWLLGMPTSAAILWTVPHFLFDSIEGAALLAMVAVGVAVGLSGWLLTR